MAYQKQNWEDLPSTNTPITASRLNHMEDGIQEANKYNIYILTGSITVPAESSNSEMISYPTNYTSENCVPISFGLTLNNSQGMNYFGVGLDSSDILRTAYNRSLNFRSDGISIFVKNIATSERVLNYKIVLMKIS